MKSELFNAENKMSGLKREALFLIKVMYNSRAKLAVFLYTLLALVIIIGTVMYMVEGNANGFDSIPKSIYWTIVTITTVGYGDIAPQTPLGQFIASIVMLIGYAIIAVPTGVVTVEYTRSKNIRKKMTCPACSKSGHDSDADYCIYCGESLK